jgi:hypothetical protein
MIRVMLSQQKFQQIEWCEPLAITSYVIFSAIHHPAQLLRDTVIE